MDFFERQSKARRHTTLLVFYFILAVALIVLAIYLVVDLALFGGGLKHHNYAYDGALALSLWNPQLFLWVALGTLAVVGISSISKMSELSQGGSAVATMLGGQPVNPNTTDPDERKLLNVVEEMAIASGTPVPQVYLLPDESINAFAAGHTTSDAVIGVTRGCMKLLTRDELQGVIGHEFSHILNGDMRLNIRLIGFIFGIMGLAIVGRILLQMRGRGSRDRNPLPLLGLALLLIGWIGVFFGRLIQSAVSRQREFLADASSVQFTRNPEGLAGALKKIGGLSYGSRLESPHADVASHMFFANGMAESLFNLMATHPPLENRIHAIDPNWDGTFPAVMPAQAGMADEYAPQAGRPKRPPIFIGLPTPLPVTAGFAPPVIRPETLLPGLGSPVTAHLRYAADWRASLPASVETAAREPAGATALVYALLLSTDDAVRQSQLEKLRNGTAPGVCEETVRLLPDVTAVAARAKLPLVDLALPALRNLSPRQFAQFADAIKVLIEADGEIDLFEYVLQETVLRHLEPRFTGARKPVMQFYSVKPLLPDCTVLLSAVARVGQQEARQIEAAFHLGWQYLRMPSAAPQVLPPAECDLEKVDAALSRLSQAVPQIKKNVLSACAYAVAADGVIKEEEAELLRAIADTLDCPIPPFVEGV